VTEADRAPPTRETILECLRAADVPLTPSDLAQRLGVTAAQSGPLLRRLAAMERDGQLLPNRKGVLLLATRLDLIAGRVQGHRDGFGFLLPDAGGPDLFLSPREMQKAMHGDRVLVRRVGYDSRGRPEGSIVEVTERAHRRLVGRFVNERGVHIVIPEDQRIKHDIIVAPADTGGAQHGQVVTIEIVSPPANGAPPIGRVVEVLGEIGDPGMEIEIAVRKFDVPHQFRPAAVEQASQFAPRVRPADIRDRVDLRDVPLVTIDGQDARDFDDAVYCEPIEFDAQEMPVLDGGLGEGSEAWAAAAGKNASHAAAAAATVVAVASPASGKRRRAGAPKRKESGFRLLVAIADVSHYVRPGDALDTDALERCTSVYFPRRVIPMLPEALSNGLCSLNPEVDRLVLVCDLVVDLQGRIRAYQFYEAVMHSSARLTYDEVWTLLSGAAGLRTNVTANRAALLPHLQQLHELYRVFAGARSRRGALELETVETKIVCDPLGRIERIVPSVRNDAHRLIEECMLAANVCAADFLQRREHAGLYRVHEGPTPEKLARLREFLRSVGLSLGGGDQPTPHDYATLAAAVRLRPDNVLLQSMLLRSMQQAIYSPDNSGHFGLAYTAYTHFTSPIRRYPDLLTHRVIKALLRDARYQPRVDESAEPGLLLQPLAEPRPAEASASRGRRRTTDSQHAEVLETWRTLGAVCSANERRADEASRDVEAWLKCQFMRERVGEQFRGRITGVAPFGLFVTLDDLFVEGLVHVSELGGEYFQFNEAAHELRGERTGRRFRLTDELAVQVSRVDLEARRIEFRMVQRAPEWVKGGPRLRPVGVGAMGDANPDVMSAITTDGTPDQPSAVVPGTKRARKAAPAKTEAVERARVERLSARRKRSGPPRRKGPASRRSKRR
jgi:ribonuclease R